jgi:CHAD domain-containing protein
MSARSYRLRREEGSAEGVRRIALGRAEKALDELAGGEGEELASAIHAARKDMKKLRAVLRLTRDELGKGLFKSENQRYREAGRLLSGTRDAEVKLKTLRALMSRFGGELPDGAAAGWEATLARERDQAAGARVSRRIEQAVRSVEEGRDRIHDWPLETNSWKLVAPGLAKSYGQGRQAMKRTLANRRASNAHEWRKRAKDLWYQLRIVHEAWPELLAETASQAHQLADLLGDHHDLAVLEQDLAGRENLVERKAFVAAIERQQEELLERAFEIGLRLYAEKPKVFRRRLKRYWSAWREA